MAQRYERVGGELAAQSVVQLSHLMDFTTRLTQVLTRVNEKLWNVMFNGPLTP